MLIKLNYLLLLLYYKLISIANKDGWMDGWMDVSGFEPRCRCKLSVYHESTMHPRYC